nr:ATP-dependent DNA helicase PcrA [Lachnospiraceae bacterium]
EHTDEADGRIENLNELISKAAVYDENEDEPSLSGFLAEVALIADIDSVEDSDNVVLLMTLHSSKGLEFPYVYIAGMEDGLFPSYLSIDSGDDAEMEEERRLAYVGITRAKKNLTLSAAMQRMLRGNIVMNPPSRFVRELPRELVDVARVSGGRPYEPFSGRNRMSSSSMALRDAMNREPKVPSYVAAARSGNPYAGQEKPYKQAPKKQFSVRGKEPLSYKEGDRVRHMRFGEGTVKEISEGGRDYEVTVQFDSVGIKKMFASFANLAKV